MFLEAILTPIKSFLKEVDKTLILDINLNFNIAEKEYSSKPLLNA